MSMELEKIEEEIFSIRSKLSELKRRIAEHEEEANRQVAQRDALHARIREIKENNKEVLDIIRGIREEAREIRARLSELFERLRSLKEERENIRAQLSGVRVPNIDEESIIKKIQEIDTMIETRPLRPEEERRLFEETKRLTRLLNDVRKKNSATSRLRAISEEAAKIREEIQQLKEKLAEKREQLNNYRDSFNQIKEQIMAVKEKADKYHQAYLEAKKKAQLLEAERILLSSRLVELQDYVRKVREEQAKTREHMVKERMKLQAIQKLNSGGKLTFDEMKVLLEDEKAWEILTKKSSV